MAQAVLPLPDALVVAEPRSWTFVSPQDMPSPSHPVPALGTQCAGRDTGLGAAFVSFSILEMKFRAFALSYILRPLFKNVTIVVDGDVFSIDSGALCD